MVYSDNERAMALARARKFQPLFKKEYFDSIVDAIQLGTPGARKAAYDNAVVGIKWLTQDEKDWLYNYLKECGDKWDNPNVPDVLAASTGW